MDTLDSLQEESQELKVFLADIAPKNLPKEILEDRMNELENLVETFGGIVILTKLQKKDQPDTKTYI
jgi:50S ribosomal subunit-associated GTPase HflX